MRPALRSSWPSNFTWLPTCVTCEVARLGTLSAAARSAHLSQPAVTQAIANVEQYFGAALFARSSAGETDTGG